MDGMQSTSLRFTQKLFCSFQSEAVRMTVLGRLTTLTHLDDVLVAEEEAADAVQMAAGSKINQVNIFCLLLIIIYRYLMFFFFLGLFCAKCKLLFK